MKQTISMLSAAAGATCILFTIAAHAGDLGPGGASAPAQSPSKVDEEINQAVSQGGRPSSADVDAQIKDLEATRTEIDQKRPAAVSLGVSGWVSEQVQFSGKQ